MQIKKIFKRNRCETAFNFALQVRQLREERGLTVEELAQESGIPVCILQRMEMGCFEDWGRNFSFAKFFDRKIRIEFY
uniref:HTH cro/C1-type domain-containing protein n=1 Tax=uncultured Alphaproteobacteria bacterium TaxID=91750 RepID=A0A6G8F2Q1_9PROT|nr:hypothetical protein PlAlph_4720 [uncultured Alphaproteobacteria bacterium]